MQQAVHDELEVQVPGADYYTSGGVKTANVVHKKKMPSDVRYDAPHDIEEYSAAASYLSENGEYKEVQMSSNQPLLLHVGQTAPHHHQIVSDLQSFVEQQQPVKKDMKSMLKELSMKKDKMLKERFKQNQAMAELTSSLSGKKDSTLKKGSTAYLGPKPDKIPRAKIKD